MQLGLIGLGKMGAGMVQRLRRDGHRLCVWDLSAAAVTAAAGADQGVEAARDVEHLCSLLTPPRLVWVMVPAGEATAATLRRLGDLLEPGDIVVDGGNSRYTDTMEAGRHLAAAGIRLLDAGTSGGIWGPEHGYCLMVGGEAAAYATAEPVLASLAPPGGHAHVGPSGSGHFVKMVHNGIEYAMMQAYGEGFELLRAGPLPVDAAQVARLWTRGSVVRSWLLELIADALEHNPDLEGIKGWVADSGEGRWALAEAVERAVAAPALAQALFARFSSRRPDAYSLRLIAALRDQFGGHGTRPSGGEE